MSAFVSITFSVPPHQTTVKGGNVRLCCIQAENVYRAWLKQGYRVAARVVSADPAVAAHVRAYLKDVAREITNDLLVDTPV